MSNPRDVAVLVGSLRKDSFNRKIAHALAAIAPPSLKLEIVEIGQLEMYNQDLDTNPPQTWAQFRARIKKSDAVLFLTPEYNRSIPGVLKNAIDVGSRPYGSSAWEKKPGGVISVSPGPSGAFGANHHLRQCLVFLDIPVLQQPEMYLGNIGSAFAPDGTVSDKKVEDKLKGFMAAYAAWVEKNG